MVKEKYNFNSLYYPKLIIFSMDRWVESAQFSKSNFSKSSRLSNLQLHRQSSLLTKLPAKDLWIKRGVVQRRTVHANVIWRERQMILTKESICFARIDSDLVVDKISMDDIISINEVNTTINGQEESTKSVTRTNQQSKARKSSVLTNISMLENLESFHEASRDFYAFEIKTCSGGFYRSYFVRVAARYDRDSWIQEIHSCIKTTLREHTDKNSWLERAQQQARDIYSLPTIRFIIAAAMLVDFLSSVFKSEFLPEAGNTTFQFFQFLDLILFIFFAFELFLNMFGSWRTMLGNPFVSKTSNWFQVATVVCQLISFSEPTVSSFKVVRIIRIFDVGSAFKSLASCQMILKAIRQGEIMPLSKETLLCRLDLETCTK